MKADNMVHAGKIYYEVSKVITANMPEILNHLRSEPSDDPWVYEDLENSTGFHINISDYDSIGVARVDLIPCPEITGPTVLVKAVFLETLCFGYANSDRFMDECKKIHKSIKRNNLVRAKSGDSL